MPQRKLIANVTLSLDGRVAGDDNDMSWLLRHASQEQMASHTAGLWQGTSTVLLGRANYEGFHSYSGTSRRRYGRSRPRRGATS